MVGLRRALALLILGFFFSQLFMVAMLGPSETFALYLGLALCYGIAFFGLAAEWFWGRWFAMGIGNFGSVFLLLMLQLGFEPILAFFGGTHALVAVLLMGEGMASRYERSEHTKERWNFQEESLVLMRRAFKSAGSTLPLLVMYFFAPKPEAVTLAVFAMAAVAALGLARGKTWGLIPLLGISATCLAHGIWGSFGPATALTETSAVPAML
ncbi:MAG: hypothetical protein ACPHRO_06485, partial [Nannocystaceae bacterium]